MALVHRINFKHKNHKIMRTKFDSFVDIAAFFYPLFGIPQVINVLQGRTDGVSLIYWVATALYALLFLLYGVKHRTEPMIIIYGMWTIINLLIIFGLLVNS